MLARLAFLLLLISPPIALAADAPPGGKITVPPAPKVADAPQPTPAAMSPLPAAAPAPEDPSDCRMDCAQRYYVCRGGDQPDDCGGGWGQCVATCNSPNLAPPAAPGA